jgi:hypothetical protein
MFNNINFAISDIEREKEIAKIVRKNIDFFKDHGIKFTQPDREIAKEYNINKYEDYRGKLESKWGEKENVFVQHLLSFFNKSEKTQFTVEISNYGPLGFYNFNTNTITINLNMDLDPTETIKHEMIHIVLEPFVKKYHIEHEQKENIVHTILEILESIK